MAQIRISSFLLLARTHSNNSRCLVCHFRPGLPGSVQSLPPFPSPVDWVTVAVGLGVSFSAGRPGQVLSINFMAYKGIFFVRHKIYGVQRHFLCMSFWADFLLRAVRPRLLRWRAGSAGIQHRRPPPKKASVLSRVYYYYYYY